MEGFVDKKQYSLAEVEVTIIVEESNTARTKTPTTPLSLFFISFHTLDNSLVTPSIYSKILRPS